MKVDEEVLGSQYDNNVPSVPEGPLEPLVIGISLFDVLQPPDPDNIPPEL